MVKQQPPSSHCIWNYPANKSTLSKLIKSLDPVKTVTLLSPNTLELPPILHDGIKKTCTLQEVLNSNSLSAISIPSNDTHDTFLIRNGKVFMLLAPESFTLFGLDGKKYGSRYLVIYDTKVSGNRKDRLLWALNNTITSKYEFIIYASESSGGTRTPQISKVINVAIPKFTPPSGDDEDEFDDWSNSIIEWIGVAALSPNLLAKNNGGIDPAICDYMHPEEGQNTPVSFTRIAKNGITAHDIRNIWDAIEYQPSWAVLHVQGFENSPICWSEDKPHSVGTEVGYTIIKSEGSETGYFKYLA